MCVRKKLIVICVDLHIPTVMTQCTIEVTSPPALFNLGMDEHVLVKCIDSLKSLLHLHPSHVNYLSRSCFIGIYISLQSESD